MYEEIKKSNVFYSIEVNKHRENFVRTEGIYLYNKAGKRFMDTVGGAVCVSIGLGIQEVIEAMYEQSKRAGYILTLWHTHDVQEELARIVSSFAPPSLSRVLFVSGGSEATETGLKMARQYHVERGNSSKYRVISRWYSYHGNTIGALSMSGRYSWRKNYAPYLLDFPHIPPPFCLRCPWGKVYPGCDLECAYELERVIKLEGSETISAFIAEPISGGTLGAVVPPPEYFPIIREICDKYDILFIVDEVITGFGRTGKNFGIDHWGVVPDIICTAKGITSGYAPMGAAIAHEKIFDAISEGSGVFTHGFTYGGNPLSCAAGIAVMNYIIKNEMVQRVNYMGEILFSKLAPLKDLPIVGDIRGKGLLAGIEFVADKDTLKPFKKEQMVGKTIEETANKKGLILLTMGGTVDGVDGDHLIIGPAYTITEDEITEMVGLIESTIVEVQRKLGY